MAKNILIIGAGLAGTTCAYLLARAGCSVTLLERSTIAVKNKLCGGLITNRSVREMAAVFGEVPTRLFQSSFDTMECITDDYDIVLHDVELRSLQRCELDLFALDACVNAGANLVEHFFIDSIDIDEHTVSGVHIASDNSREQQSFRFDILIGADGAHSLTRKLICGFFPECILTLETEVNACGAPLTVFCNEELFGYAWYIPVGMHAKLGCGSFREANLDEQLTRFAERLGVNYDTRRGAFLPTGSNVCLNHANVHFIGDAAGLICAPSGEGIYYALRSANMLARSIVDQVDYGLLMKHDLRTVARERMMRNLFYNRHLQHLGISISDLTFRERQSAVKWAFKHFCSFA